MEPTPSGVPAREDTKEEDAPSSPSLSVAPPPTVSTAAPVNTSTTPAAFDHPMSDTDTASSRLSSPASRSPSPPSEYDLSQSYPSPSASQESSLDTSEQEGSPSPDCMPSRARPRDEDGAPPAKRRRVTEPKIRTTEHLDLSTDNVPAEQQEQLARLLKVLHKRRKIVVVAGAGISVSAGIPDFRSSTGLFKSLKSEHKLKSTGKDLFDASVYKDDKSTTQFHDMVRNLSQMTKDAKPTIFHHALATLAQQDRLLRLYTQNVDCIDTRLPPLATTVPLNRKGPWPKTIQLHGNVEKMVCSKCHEMSDLNPELFEGPETPLCPHCLEADTLRTEHAGKRSHGVGRLRPRMVLYNEHNPDDEAIGAVMKADLLKRPDALIVVGTTLKIPGVKRLVKELCGLVRDRRDGLTIWINHEPPPPVKDFEWDLIVKGPCDEVARLASLRKWNEPDDVEPATKEQTEELKSLPSPKVVIFSPAKNKATELVTGIPTPVASPKLFGRSADKKTIPASTGFKPSSGLSSRKAGNGLPGKPAETKLKLTVKEPMAKAAPTKPRKASAGRKKAIVQPRQRLTQSFKAGKASSALAREIELSDKKSGYSQFQVEGMNAGNSDIENIPEKGYQSPSSHAMKEEAVRLLENHSPSMPSSSPPRPQLEPLSPNSPRVNSIEPVPTSFWGVPSWKFFKTPIQRPETKEERQRTISPPTFPKGMRRFIS